MHGARQHNLKNIDVEIPRNTFTVITGLSGSGKSSLAFDTIYAEGQRRYVETLSPYARQFLDQMERPEVDSIDGLSPAISIEQKDHQPQPAFHRRYHHGNLRLSARPVRLHRHSALPQLRTRNFAPDHRSDRAAGDGAEPAGAGHDSGADRARAQGRIQEGAGKTRAAGLRASPNRWRAALAGRRDHARPAQESHHRSGGRPVADQAGDREAPGSLGGHRDQAGRRIGDGRGGERRRSGCIRRSWPVRIAAPAFRNWSRARSPSTARSAPARPATA